MTVTLTTEQEKFVAEQLKSGHYQSAAEVVAKSLGMLRAQEDFVRLNAVTLRAKIASGIKQIENGDVVDGKSAIAKLRKKLQRRERGRG